MIKYISTPVFSKVHCIIRPNPARTWINFWLSRLFFREKTHHFIVLFQIEMPGIIAASLAWIRLSRKEIFTKMPLLDLSRGWLRWRWSFRASFSSWNSMRVSLRKLKMLLWRNSMKLISRFLNWRLKIKSFRMIKLNWLVLTGRICKI